MLCRISDRPWLRLGLLTGVVARQLSLAVRKVYEGDECADGSVSRRHCVIMRSAIALTLVLSGIVSGCSGTTIADSGVTATGGTQAGSSTDEANAKGGGAATTSERKATGGSSARTSSRGSAASTGGSSSSRANSASGGTSAETDVGEGGHTADSSSAVGGQSKGSKSSSGGTATTGSKSAAGGSSTNANTTSGQTSAGGSSSGGTSAQSTGGGTAENSGKSAGCGKASAITSGQYNNGQPISITAGGKQRRYILNVPSGYDNSKPYRLVVVYHQLDGNDKQMYNWQYYGLLPLSNNSTIFVAPNGQKNGSPCSGTGDGDSGCGWPNSGDSDLALADAVVAQIEENFCIDKTRIFATGWSYGGSMSYRTACSRPQGGTAAPWGVRGIAVYSAAQLSGNCTPSKPVAYFHAHGTRDGVLNYDSMGMPLAQNFAKANGCTWATPTKVTSGAHVCTNLAGCTDGYPLEFCSFNGDHTPFPDNGQAQGSWGPAEAWKFISQF